MGFKLRYCWALILFGFMFHYLLFIPEISGYSELEQNQIVFTVNETFDLSSVQNLSYQFPLWLDWVGSHARVRIQGGVVTGDTPNNLEINVVLDGIKTQQVFTKMDGLQKHYTFHSTSEYVVEIPPPVRPTLDGIQTLHNLTIELNFEYISTPDGTGLVYQIVFETFTPPTLDTIKPQQLILVQDQFSWEIGLWSFGRCFFNTSLIIPLYEPQNLSLSLTVEFSGLTLESWQIDIEQGVSKLHVRDNQTLYGILEFDPDRPCELRLIVDPPQVSEPEIINVSFKVQGTILLLPEPSSSNIHTSDPTSEKRLNEGILLFQLGLVILPILTYYRVRRPDPKNSRQEKKK